MLKRIDKQLLILSIILFSFGLIMIYSASNVTAFMVNDASPWRYFIKELIFLFIGLIGSLIIIKTSFKKYFRLSYLLTIFLGISIFLLIIYGTATNGANNWIGYKGFGIQPSEFVKIAIIPFFAFYYEKNIKHNDNKIKMLIPPIIGAIIALLIVGQKDLGTAFIFSLIIVFMFIFSPISSKIKKDIIGKGLIIIVIGILLLITIGDKILPEDKLARFDFNAPCENYINEGNQLCNGFIAMNSGGIFGKGLGNSTQKYLYLPEPYTDFIFAILVEELGIIGGVALIALYMLLITRIVVIGKKSNRISSTMMCYTIAFYIFIHIVVNLGGVLGVIPMTGVTLPFISYGGSICISILAALAIVQKVAIENKKQQKN